MMPTLISMTKDEAVVAEQVTTYRREELELELEALKKQNDLDAAVVPLLEKQVTEAKTRLASNAYKLELYTALIEAFNRDYPKPKVSLTEQAESIPEAQPTVEVKEAAQPFTTPQDEAEHPQETIDQMKEAMDFIAPVTLSTIPE